MRTDSGAFQIFSFFPFSLLRGDVDAISERAAEDGGRERRRDACFPDISYNVEKRSRIRVLFRARAFKLIMDGRISLSLPSLSSPEAIPTRDERNGTRERMGKKKRPAAGAAGIYNTRGWMDGWMAGERSGGWGRPHKYGNFVNQVSWRSVVEFFKGDREQRYFSIFYRPVFLCFFCFFFFPACISSRCCAEMCCGPGDLTGN